MTISIEYKTEDSKECSRCNQTKHALEFYLDRRYRQGIAGWCKSCRRDYSLEHRLHVKHNPKVAPESRKCCACKVEKPISEFGKSTNSKTGFKPRCRDCRKIEYRSALDRDPGERVRRQAELKLWTLYRLRIEDYHALLESQGGKCAVCSVDFSLGKKPNIDHCHKTGSVRGILCSRCNTLLGHIEQPGLVNRALAYLARTGMDVEAAS